MWQMTGREPIAMGPVHRRRTWGPGETSPAYVAATTNTAAVAAAYCCSGAVDGGRSENTDNERQLSGIDGRVKQARQGRRNSAVWAIGHCPVDSTRTPASPTPTSSSASMPATPFFSPCSCRLASGSARRWTNPGSEVALAAEKDNSYGVCDHGERTSLAAPTRQSTIRLSKVFCEDDGYETADDGSSGGLLQENSAMPVSLAPSSSTSSGAGGAGGGVRRDVGNNRRGVDVVADKDGQAGFLSRTAFAAMSVAAPGNDGNNSDDDCWDTVIDDEAGSLPVAAREEEGGRQARSSSQRTGAILADPPSPVLFRAGNGYDRGAEVLIPPDGPGGLPVVACPPPRLTRLRTTPEGRVVASDAAVVPIPRRKRRGRRRQRRVRELDVPTTAAASVLNRALEFDGDGCSSSNSGGGGGGPGRSGEAAFDRIPQWQAGGRGDGGGSRTPSGAFKSPAPDANATSHRRRIPPTPARQRCAFEDEESDDDDETAQQDGGEGKNVEHKRTRSEPASILPRPHARGELGTAAYYETLRQDGEQGKTHWPAMTVGTGGSSGGGSPSRSIALRYDGDGERPSADGGVVSRRIARGWVTGTGFGGPRSAPSSRRGSGTKRGGGGGWKNSGYTAVLGRLKGMLNLESKPRTPPVRRMSRMEMHKAYLIAESFRTPGGSPLDRSSPAAFDDEGYPEDVVLPGVQDAEVQRERRRQVEGRRGGGRSTRVWRGTRRGAAGDHQETVVNLR